MRHSSQSRILIVDDDLLTLDVLTFAALKYPEISMSVASDLKNAVSLLREGAVFDLVVLDVRMPDTQGIMGLNIIRNFSSSLPVAFMTGQSDDDLLQEAKKSDASGFLLKSQPISKLIDCFRRMASGTRCFSDDCSTSLA